MKTYEKYLLTEAKSIKKKIEALRMKLMNISTPVELRMAISALSEFMRKNEYTDEIRDEFLGMIEKAKKAI